jgi:Holliday junction resolvase-like predicted endonuclease
MDNQITGLAGEYFVAAELLKRGWQVAVTLGNSKAIDLVATKESGEIHRIRVKTLRSGPNCFTLHTGKVKPNDFYVFVWNKLK